MNSNGVEYLIVGSYAVGYHGYPRGTNDIDIWVRPSEANAERVVHALRQFGFDVPALSRTLFTERSKITRMGVPPFRIELFTDLSGVEFDECYANRLGTELDGVSVSMISLPHLKQNKRAAGRLKDLADLENLP